PGGVVQARVTRRESDEKGPSASLTPSTARSTYREYASRAAIGRRLAAGPFSSLWRGFSDRLLATLRPLDGDAGDPGIDIGQNLIGDRPRPLREVLAGDALVAVPA